MIEAITKGIGAGLILAMIPGPVFFALVETSIKRGFISAFFLELGIVLSDLLLLTLAYFTTTTIELNEEIVSYFSLIGGILLMLMGTYKLFKGEINVRLKQKEFRVETEHFLKSIIKGFLLNAINPGVLVFWSTIIFIGIANFPVKFEAIIFFVSILGTLFSADILKAFLARYLRRYFTSLIMGRVSQGIGLVFVIFGIILILREA